MYSLFSFFFFGITIFKVASVTTAKTQEYLWRKVRKVTSTGSPSMLCTVSRPLGWTRSRPQTVTNTSLSRKRATSRFEGLRGLGAARVAALTFPINEGVTS